jgi:hypothetical protein
MERFFDELVDGVVKLFDGKMDSTEREDFKELLSDLVEATGETVGLATFQERMILLLAIIILKVVIKRLKRAEEVEDG